MSASAKTSTGAAAQLQMGPLEVGGGAAATSMPARVEPVMETNRGRCDTSPPCPIAADHVEYARRQELRANSASRSVDTGVVSDGLSTTYCRRQRRRELPHAIISGSSRRH